MKLLKKQMKTKSFFLGLFFLLLIGNLNAQNEDLPRVEIEDEYLFLNHPFLEDDEKWAFRFYLHTFFKNNEYFGDFVKGYTLTGFHLCPQLTYNYNSMLKIQVIWNILKYNGYDNFSEYKPYARIVFRPKKCFSVICGYLEGNIRHKLTEPIYNPERYYTDNIENGLQFLVNKPHRYDGDTWLNWEKFILWGDPWQEQLTFGHHSDFQVIHNKSFSAGLSGELLISHQGGQIDATNEKVQSLENGGLGVFFRKVGSVDSRSFRFFSVESFFLQFHCIDPTPSIPYLDGYAIYNKAFLKFSNFGLTLGDWYANRFINFRGDKLFTCRAIETTDNKTNRNVIFSELFFCKDYFDNVFTLKAGINGYFDTDELTMEYSYMFSMIFSIKKTTHARGFFK